MNSGFIRQAIPEIVSGYDVRNWDFTVIVPEASANLVTDPSFEVVTTGVNTAVSSSLARSTTRQKRGAYSMAITPNSGVVSGMYQSYALTGGLPYTFSLDLYGVPGQQYDLFFTDNSGNIVSGVRTVQALGFWQRASIMYQPVANATYRIYLRRKSYTSTAVFYTDGWQLEQKAYPTTYFDGDSSGFVPGKNDFWWNGPAHQSTSTRSSQTRAGGREMSLNSIVTFLAIIGLGMSPVANIALPNSMGWAIHQDSFATSRDFTLAASIFGNTMLEISQKREAIINMVKPDIVSPAQPMILRARPLMSGQPCGEAIDIVCSYKGGMEGGIASEGQERIGLQFNLYLPFISNDGDNAASLAVNTSISGFTNIGYRDASGYWHAMSGGVNGEVYDIKDAMDGLGSVYVVGNFTQAGAVANTGYIAKWTPGVGWSSVGGSANSYITAIYVLDASNFIVGGNFTTIGGVAANYVARWNGSTYVAIPGINSVVFDVVAYSTTSIAVGSGFEFFATWNGSSWAIGTSPAWHSPAYQLYKSKRYSIIAGGSNTMSEPTDGGGYTYGIVKNASQMSTKRIGTTTISINILPGAITESIDNDLIVGTGDAIWKFNGLTWVKTTVTNNTVKALAYDRDNVLYAGGEYTTIGGVSALFKLAYMKYGSNIWMPIEISITNTRINAIVAMADGNLFVGGLFGTTAVTPAQTTVINNGNANASPTIQITGPGVLKVIRNRSNNKEIQISGLTLVAGDVYNLEFDIESGITFVNADTGMTAMDTIKDGSDLDFFLQPGENLIEVFMTGTTGASSVVMTWKVSNWGLDGR